MTFYLFTPGNVICIGLLTLVIFLYFSDPIEFLERERFRFIRLRFRFSREFRKIVRTRKANVKRLNTISFVCSEAICKYITRQSECDELSNDETVKVLVKIYRKLEKVQRECLAGELTDEDFKQFFNQIEDAYCVEMDPYFCEEDEWKSA